MAKCLYCYVLFVHRSADELLLTEMVFNGAFNDLTAQQCVALLSCFVFQEKVSIKDIFIVFRFDFS